MDKKYISDNKRVILITGDNSKWYEQAIFIVRKTAAPAAQTDLLREAELIVSGYMDGYGHTPAVINAAKKAAPDKTAAKGVSAKQKTTFDTVVNILIILSASVLLTLLSRGIF